MYLELFNFFLAEKNDCQLKGAKDLEDQQKFWNVYFITHLLYLLITLQYSITISVGYTTE